MNAQSGKNFKPYNPRHQKQTKTTHRKSRKRTVIIQQPNFHFPPVVHPTGREFWDSSPAIGNHPAYTPNEDELKLTNLTPYHASLVSTTQAVDQTEAELNVKLIERDQIFYTDGTGLYSIALNVKKYVKGLYGATSPEYSNVSSIEFVNRK